MSFKSFLYDYGERVPGYDVTVINEREARAAAGILFMLGMIVIFVAIGFNHTMVARVYLGVLFFDFFAKTISPNYSPSLLLGKLAVRNQKPEYVGGLQKRFAWTLGWLISIPMFYWFVWQWDITFYKVLICVLCLTLMFLEAAFSICVGCIIYEVLLRKKPEHCPGGVCEIKQIEPVQMFNPLQKIIVAVTMIGLVIGIYSFLAHTESKTFFGVFLNELVLTDAQLQQAKDDLFEKQAALEFGDDDDDYD
ncbi:MAG: DUF4395 domain-containing protein [Sulfurimonas sp.]|nr:DUF4395 domain-containing protein [Sulfurimonas sp.]MDQ7061053.1 DUF4395 domain-containing protein [Sulfurimonas sp.]